MVKRIVIELLGHSEMQDPVTADSKIKKIASFVLMCCFTIFNALVDLCKVRDGTPGYHGFP